MTIVLDFTHPVLLVVGAIGLLFTSVALGVFFAAVVWRITYPFLALVSVICLRISLIRHGLRAKLDMHVICGDWRFITHGHTCVMIQVENKDFTPAVWHGLFKWMYPMQYTFLEPRKRDDHSVL